jgi:hypothetical protein
MMRAKRACLKIDKAELQKFNNLGLCNRCRAMLFRRDTAVQSESSPTSELVGRRVGDQQEALRPALRHSL